MYASIFSDPYVRIVRTAMGIFVEPIHKPFLYVTLALLTIIFVSAFVSQFIGCDLFTFWQNPFFFIEPRVRIYG